MNKTEYIIRTLARTKRKDYENYVINRLYTELNDLDIQPVSQQYVKRNDKNGEKKYALLDLYFPQLNIGVECNEAHHLEQRIEDNKRKIDVEISIDENLKKAEELSFFEVATVVEKSNSYKEIPIEIYDIQGGKKKMRSIEDINNDISEAVQQIKDAKNANKNFTPWDNSPDIEKALKNKKIRVEDNFTFTQEEIRRFFGRTGITQKSFYKLDESHHLWLPGLAIEEDQKFIPFNKKSDFINFISKDDDEITIYECLIDESELNEEKFNRIVFMKLIDPILRKSVYKFAGVFKREIEEEKKVINGNERRVIKYRQISKEVRI